MKQPGTPVICQLQGQVMAHRAVMTSVLTSLRLTGVLSPAVLEALDRSLSELANATLDAIREAPEGSVEAHDAEHLAAGFDAELQAMIAALRS